MKSYLVRMKSGNVLHVNAEEVLDIQDILKAEGINPDKVSAIAPDLTDSQWDGYFYSEHDKGLLECWGDDWQKCHQLLNDLGCPGMGGSTVVQRLRLWLKEKESSDT